MATITETGDARASTGTSYTIDLVDRPDVQVVPVGEAVAGTLTGDTASFVFSAEGRGFYSIAVSGIEGENGLADPLIRIYDDSGDLLEIDDNDGPGNDAAAVLGTRFLESFYEVEVSSADGGTGDFEISVTEGLAPPLTPLADGERFDGTFDLIDGRLERREVVGLQVEAGVYQEVELSGGPVDRRYHYLYYSILDEDGRLVTDYGVYDAGDWSQVFSFVPYETATYTLVASNNAFEDAAAAYDYSVELTALPDVDTILEGETETGTLTQETPVAIYLFRPRAYLSKVTVTVASAAGEGALADPMVKVYSSQGYLMAADDNDGAGNDAMASFDGGDDDLFRIEVSAADGGVGAFDLSLVEGLPPPLATLAPGERYAGALEVFDDYFEDLETIALNVEADVFYEVTVSGAGTGASGDVIALKLYGPDGNSIYVRSEIDRPWSESLTFLTDSDTPLELKLRTYSTLSEDLDYTVDYVRREGFVRAGRYEDGPVTGTLEAAGGEVWYRLDELGDDAQLTISAESAGGESGLADPYIHVYDVFGDIIASDDNDGEGLNALAGVRLSTNLDDDDYLFVAVGGTDGTTGDYILSVTGGRPVIGTVTPEAPFEGVLDPDDDEEYVTAELEAGTTYTIVVSPELGSPGYLMASFSGPDDEYVYLSEVIPDRRGTTRALFTPATDGTFGILVWDFLNSGAGSLPYSVRLVPATDAPLDRGLFSLDTPTEGVIETVDGTHLIDYDLVAGTTYVFALPRDFRHAVDEDGLHMALSGPSGRVFEEAAPATGAEAASTIVFTPGASGRYTLSVAGSEVSDTFPEYRIDIAYSDAEAPTILEGSLKQDEIAGTEGADIIFGHLYSDTIDGLAGDDWLTGGDGADTINGGAGDDRIMGGGGYEDLRDVVSGGCGDDTIDGGFGNDALEGGAGNDIIEGGFGVDELAGNSGDDTLTGGAFSDLVFGGAGADFVNGGFGYDRIHGGAGADRFYHLGIADHGSDWIQDYSAADGDVLLFGQEGASAEDFRVNLAETEGAGAARVEESFVVYLPTGQTIWALVDGGAEASISLQIAGSDAVFEIA